MTRSQRLTPVVDMNKRNEQKAARLLSDSQSNLAEREHKLQELVRYREDYAARFSALGHSGAMANQLQDYRAFLANMNTAIAHQMKFVAMARQEFQEKRGAWTRLHEKATALENVIGRYRSQERYHSDLKEQAEGDARSQQLSSLLETD